MKTLADVALVVVLGVQVAAAAYREAGVAQARPETSLRGTWTASVGSTPSFHGTWTADLQPQTPNTATGSWTLLNASNQVIAEGTWSAVKSPRTWSGTWSARVLPAGGGAAARSRLRSGSWRADVPAGGGAAATFSQMLRSTLEKQITGAWRSAGLQGRWWLSASG